MKNEPRNQLLSEIRLDHDTQSDRAFYWFLDWVLFLPSTLVRRKPKWVRFIVLILSMPWVCATGVIGFPLVIYVMLADMWEQC